NPQVPAAARSTTKGPAGAAAIDGLLLRGLYLFNSKQQEVIVDYFRNLVGSPFFNVDPNNQAKVIKSTIPNNPHWAFPYELRLEHLSPFPNEENFRKTQEALDNYVASLNKLKEELKAQSVPVSPLAPNEFQSRLRQAIVNTTEKARTNRVKLPENFHLGFDEFT